MPYTRPMKRLIGEAMIEQIVIADRATVERGLSIRAGGYCLISITDPGSRRIRVRRSSALRAVLDLRFHDAEPTGGFKLPPDIKLMTEDEAKQIGEFVLKYHDHINALVVHCEQGMSRSPGVGAAIAATLGLDTTPFEREYQPNAYVQELVLDAFDKIQSRQSDGDVSAT